MSLVSQNYEPPTIWEGAGTLFAGRGEESERDGENCATLSNVAECVCTLDHFPYNTQVYNRKIFARLGRVHSCLNKGYHRTCVCESVQNLQGMHFFSARCGGGMRWPRLEAVCGDSRLCGSSVYRIVFGWSVSFWSLVNLYARAAIRLVIEISIKRLNRVSDY